MSGKFDVILKSIELMKYTMTITSNRKRYPSKYIQIVQRIQNLAMDIYEHLFDANRLDINTSILERSTLQSKAIAACDKLSCFIDLSMSLNLVGTDTVGFWQEKINSVKYMTIAWQKNDKRRLEGKK